jgi:hypothetical protein
MKRGDKLICYNNERNRNSLTIGKAYLVMSVGRFNGYDILTMVDDRGYRRRFTVMPDNRGLSYNTWFTRIETFKPIEIIKKVELT